VFTHLLLADEINRAPAKTQAALLEVMQEKQVTLEGTRHVLTPPFMVLATQNPIEHEGTYPLPEAQLDRFLLKIYIDYPDQEHEIALTRQITTNQAEDMQALGTDLALMSPDDIVAMQQLCAALTIDDAVLAYAVRLVRATREHAALLRGAGSRAGIALVRTAKARALLRGADFVLPDDVKAMAGAVMRHRVALAPDSEIDGISVDQVLSDVIQSVEAPRA
jgi:MoxR-like ATPase